MESRGDMMVWLAQEMIKVKSKPCMMMEYKHVTSREEPETEVHGMRMVLPREEVMWMAEGMVAWDSDRVEDLQYTALT